MARCAHARRPLGPSVRRRRTVRDRRRLAGLAGPQEHRGWLWIGAGVIALGAYGLVATLQPEGEFGRILAAYGGVFVAGSIAWGVVADGYRPDRWDILGALVCLAGMALIMYAPRGR